MDLEFDITVKTAEDMAERLEKELIGAWRAGYDYFYFAPEIDPWNHSRTETTLTIQYNVLATERKIENNPLGKPLTVYDLSELTAGEYHEVKNGL